MTTGASIIRPTSVITPQGKTETREHVAIETPYTIMLNEVEIGASMVLPIGLEEFGAGFLFGQGYIDSPEQIVEVLVCADGRISVYAKVEHTEPKNVIISSGCGGTGKIPRDMLEGVLEPPLEYSITFPEVREFILSVLRASELGPRTHCVHGCGLWGADGMQVFYEDVGRHNAVDKVLGAILLGKASPHGAIYTTGRLTSDMVLKCARMRIPILMSRTAPSSLGVAIAERAGLTVAAYARPERLNVFNRADRIHS